MNPSERFTVHARSYRHKKTGCIIVVHRRETMLNLHKKGIKLSEYIPESIIHDPKIK